MHIADLLNNELAAGQLAEQGYTVLKVLDDADIRRLRELYDETIGRISYEHGFFTSIAVRDEDYRTAVSKGITAIMLPKLLQYFTDVQPAFSNFMMKTQGKGTGLDAHQDWSFTKEPDYDSVTVWCPLIHTHPGNGGLKIIPRSHLLRNHIRGRFFGNVLQGISGRRLESLFRDIPVKAGEALVFNTRCFHASSDNLSDEIRVAAATVLLPGQAPLLHWVLDKESSAKTYRELSVDSAFFSKYNCLDPLEDVPASAVFPYNEMRYTLKELENVLGVKYNLKQRIGHILKEVFVSDGR